MGDLSGIGGVTLVRALAVFDDTNGAGPPSLIASGITNGSVARWNGSHWASLANPGEIGLISAIQGMDDTLYMGGSAPSFAKWSSTKTALAIMSQSQSGSFEPGITVQLEVTVAHGGAVTYQWRRNGLPLIESAPISGSKSNRLVIYNISGAFEGTYDLVVSNDCESVFSDPINVEVIGTCAGDIAGGSAPQSGDGVVNESDLLLVISSWGACPALPLLCPADLAPFGGDGAVDNNDLNFVLSAWGPCPRQ